MLFDVASQWLSRPLYLLDKQAGDVASVTVTVAVVVLVGLLLWRLWTFSILPALRPNEPKELPYWIPGMSSFLPAQLRSGMTSLADAGFYSSRYGRLPCIG